MARRVVTLMWIVLLVVACDTGARPSAAPVPGRDLAGQRLAACTIKGEVPVAARSAALCGTLVVPEDRTRPDGRKIALRVAVVPASAPSAESTPLFVLAGGPGDASTQFFAWLPGLYADVHATRDIVLVDQRGTGASYALTMPPMPDTAGTSAAEADARLAAWARDAVAGLEADPRMYTSMVAADDLDAVRQALGYDRIDLYGTSYGGELAQYYLRQHADRVRVAVMDGTTPLDVPVFEVMAATSQHAMDLVLTRCANDPACQRAFPDLANEWSAMIAAFRPGVEVTDPVTGERGTATLATVGPSVHNALMTEDRAARLPLAIHLMTQGDVQRVNELVPAVSGSPSTGTTLLMRDEILCSEAWARWDPGEVARNAPDSYALPFITEWANEQAALCRYLPRGLVPADDAAPVTTDRPILWLAGDGDPQDPPSNLARVASQQPNSLVVIVPAQEHVVGHLGCGPRVVAAFLDAGRTAGLDTACLTSRSGSPAPAFTLH